MTKNPTYVILDFGCTRSMGSMKAVKAFKSQVYDKKSNEAETPTSSMNFLNSIESRAKNLGRLIFSDAAEGFTSERVLAVEDFDALL